MSDLRCGLQGLKQRANGKEALLLALFGVVPLILVNMIQLSQCRSVFTPSLPLHANQDCVPEGSFHEDRSGNEQTK